MKKYIKYFKYPLLFLFFLFGLMFVFNLSRGDTFVNYGFSYAIARGEIPYKDFNMVITPFSPFIYSIGLLINNSILTYYIEQSLLLVLLYIVIEKLINKKSIIFLTILFIIYPIAFSTTIFPGYNFICLLLLFITLFLEKNNSNNYLIGFILGLIFCTKQTIGVFLFFPTLIYLFKNRNIFIKRLIGYLIPIFLLIIYLLITGSFYQFINLCFLGLFNFGKGNNTYSLFYFIVLVVGLFINIYKIVKNRKDISNYYILCFIVVCLPIIDYYHVSIYLLGVVYLIIKDLNIRDIYYKYILIISILLYILGICSVLLFFDNMIITNYNNFNFYIISRIDYYNTNKMLKEMNKYKDRSIVLLLKGSNNYFYRIVNDMDINYYDLPNIGNYGYNGEDLMVKKIEKLEDTIFIVDDYVCDNYDKFQQYICEFRDAAIHNSIKIKSIGKYSIYERGKF